MNRNAYLWFSESGFDKADRHILCGASVYVRFNNVDTVVRG